MPGQIRPNAKAAKITYNVLKIPKDQQQHNEKQPSERRQKEWSVKSPAWK